MRLNLPIRTLYSLILGLSESIIIIIIIIIII